ncbi:Putative arginine/ornithine antiporter [Avibacterium paragallinarum JF4211]|uniref:Arginine/ornithine antiporter protein n=1 Tax=Avibacterium paragallinarum TaxID=728 RepID=A0A377IC86_AVIPA|nr:Putative arginine/ornithine antiporter [Avibacterium paragallinarum JF4211]STO72349.1 arginine/ornithine antiporter protein [Avibacterium paragallinarum]
MSNKKIGLISLTALVLSSMIGSGIFSLPQNMAAVAGSEALLIGWLITGIGIIFLGLSFFFISRLKPELDGGIYTYAREGFGDLMGFLSAWGYWLCATIGIVGYLLVAFEGIGTFTDNESAVIFGQGNTIASFIGASCVVWLVHILIAKGVKEAASVNLVATIVKVFPLILFIALALWFFSPDTFNLDTKATALNNSVSDQVKNTMLITLWVFTGVEGAAVLSAHAKNRTDVGLAHCIGNCDCVNSLCGDHRAFFRAFTKRSHCSNGKSINGRLARIDDWKKWKSVNYVLFDCFRIGFIY